MFVSELAVGFSAECLRSRANALMLSRARSFVLSQNPRGERGEGEKTVLAERAGAICPYGFTKGSVQPVADTFDGRAGDLRK